MIDVRNISKTFHVPHEIKALVDVSTKIDPGEVVVVCGPSGSGKSTLLRCLNRLEHADSGHIYIDGIDVLDPKTNINKLRAEVGMVFQSFNLFPHKNVFDNIALAQKVVRKRSKASAEEKTKYGSNRLAEGKLPLCAEMCATKALLAGDADVLADIYRKRVINRGASVMDWREKGVDCG